MVICTYFLNNSCRFGSKCNNEHIDIGSMVNNEVDVTLKGNQWPLSCFGPFKERTCVPNFIEDQSFEEIRMMYLEAKLQNNLPAHQMQLAQMINDAKTKMQWLTTMNRDVLSTLVELYNQQESSTKPVSGLQSNPFASVGSNGSSAPTSSIFGAASSGNAFGTGFGTNAAGAVPGTTGGLFAQAAQASGNIFGSPAASTAGNIFTKPGQSQPQSNIFGMAQPSQPTNSMFGGPAVLGGGLFGSVQQPVSTPLFGAVAPQPNASSGSNIFAKPAQAPNAFGQPATGGAFGGGNMFGSPAVSATPAAGFGAVAAQPQQGAGLFNSVSFGTNQPSTPFGQFGASLQTAAPANVSSQNLFLPAPTAAPSPFGAPVGSSAFGSPAPQPSEAIQQSATMYSKLEELTPELISAFKAQEFVLGQIPTVPPPKELCH
uniref:Nucleoporin NUP42 n=1 Tax=Anopheles atroparvus TaxID=41427 RepID=A0AAG5D8L4_ANOAO